MKTWILLFVLISFLSIIFSHSKIQPVTLSPQIGIFKRSNGGRSRNNKYNMCSKNTEVIITADSRLCRGSVKESNRGKESTGVMKSVSIMAASLKSMSVRDTLRYPLSRLEVSRSRKLLTSKNMPKKSSSTSSSASSLSSSLSNPFRYSLVSKRKSKKSTTDTSKNSSKSANIIANDNNRKKKVLILMSDTGGGHRASAQAIEQAMSDAFPKKFDVEIMDIWTDHAAYPFNKFVDNYRFLAKRPLLWRGMYFYGLFPPTKLFTEVWSKSFCYKKFENAISASDPDMVVSVHPLCQQMPLSIVSDLNKKRDGSKGKIPFLTVVTDLGGAHPTWFDKRADQCFVPSEAVRDIAIRNGIDKAKICMHGLPIRPSFWKISKPKNALRKQLGLKLDDRTALLMGGGDGVGGLDKIATEVVKKLGRSAKPSQVVVICGHNRKVANNLNSQKWPSNVNVVVKGFCSNIDEFMGSADCLVTKAGPGTIAEAMIRGLPVVLSSFLPGQEAGNVPFVVDNGFGVYTGNRPKKIADTVFNFFENEGQMEIMRKNAMQNARPDATIEIAKDIGNIGLSIKSSQNVLKV